MTSRVVSRDYRLKANSPSGTIADQDTFTNDSSSRMLTGISGRYSNTVTNTFDNAGRLSTESLTIGGQTYTVTSEYDLRGMRKKVTYPNSSTWERTYTARRQLYETKYNGSTIDSRAYDDGGRLDTSTYANGVTADYNWRADNLLADIGFSHPGGVAANRRIGTYTYTWDANKNKTKETITGQIPGYSFDTTLGTDPDGYDDEDRLTYFKRQSTTNPQTWNLSLVGDWNSWSNFGTAQSRTHGPAHEILTAGNTPNNAFSHDVKGNMTDIPSNILSPARKLFWDFDNQLTGVDTTGDSTPEVTYEYDALLRRVAQIEGSNSKVYIHSGNQIIADYNRGYAANTTPAFRYVWGDYIDEPILRQTGSTTILYYHRNQQYSTIALTNTSGEVVERYGYTAYGQMTVMNYLGNVRSWSDWSNRYTYTGREWDETTRLFHFRARWYEPVAGRFVSRDPLGYVDGMNRFATTMMLDGLDPSGQLIIFVHGIKSTNDTEASILYEELCKPAQNWASRGERQAMLHLRYGYAKKDYHPILTDAGYGTWSDVNRRAGWYLAEYVKWLQKEKARLGSNEEIVVIAYSNGGNVAYEALMTPGVQVDRLLLLGTSADTTLDWKTACDKSCCRIYNNWSDSDFTARLPNGSGTSPINALECKFIQNCYVEKCYHTAEDALGDSEDTRRFRGRTSWLSRCMCREVYYKQLTDATGDGKLSAHGRMVDLVYKSSRQHGLKGPFFSPSVEFDFGKFEIGPWYRKTPIDASEKTLFPLPLK